MRIRRENIGGRLQEEKGSREGAAPCSLVQRRIEPPRRVRAVRVRVEGQQVSNGGCVAPEASHVQASLPAEPGRVGLAWVGLIGGRVIGSTICFLCVSLFWRLLV